MRPLVFAMLALWGGAAAAGGVLPRNTSAPGVLTPAPVVLRAPLTTSGAPFECGANATSCPRFTGSAISDALMTWTAQGTPVQVAANVSPFIPGTAGYGPPTDVNYYTGPANGIDGWHPAGGNFRACIEFKTNAIGAQYVPISTGNGAGGNTGFYIVQEVAGVMTFAIAAPSSVSVSTANAVAVGGPNSFCFGRDGTNAYAKLNLGTTASLGSTSWAAGVNPTHLGRLWNAGGFAFPGIIYSAVIEPLAWDEGWAADKQRRTFGVIGSFGEPVTCSRASTATYTANALEWTAPANVCRFDATGLVAEPPHTNKYLNSDAPATQTITFATGNQVAWVTGAGNIALAVGTATATGLPCNAVAATPCLFNVTVGGTVVATYTATLTFVDVGDGTRKTSAVHTAGAAVSRSADVPTTSDPLSTGDARWCVAGTVKRPSGMTFAAMGSSAGAGVWTLGASYTAANTADLYVTSTGALNLDIYDNAAALKTWSTGALSNADHAIIGCYDSGTVTIYVDGALQSPSTSGAGTGVLASMPATLTLGNLGASSFQLVGGLSAFGVSRSSDPVVF